MRMPHVLFPMLYGEGNLAIDSSRSICNTERLLEGWKVEARTTTHTICTKSQPICGQEVTTTDGRRYNIHTLDK